MPVRPLLRWTAFFLAFAAAGTAVAQTPALVVDAESGRVLHAERATDPWFPASITKLMTAYVALQLVREGRASMDQLLTVSEYAASQPPSKMAFKPGTQITLENALKIIMVKSANDVSVTIAEGLAGSVDDFAAMMNSVAQGLGMRESRWVNPNGLPDDRQQTSARDMAILARALLRNFPANRDLFNIGAIQYGRRVMANHNGLIGRYEGADGMKTGFICSSGFNVVATATRGGRQIITVVLGSPSARERTFRAADLFDRGFATLSSFGFSSTQLDELPASAVSVPPNMRPVICGPGRVTQEDDAQAASVPTAPQVTIAQGGNAENAGVLAGTSALSFASAGQPRRTLGPRAAFTPVLVWTGRSPGDVVEDEPEARPGRRTRTAKGRAARRAAAAQLRPLPELRQPPSIIQGAGAASGPKAKARPGAQVAEKPKAKPGAQARTNTAEVKRKPKPKPAE